MKKAIIYFVFGKKQKIKSGFFGWSIGILLLVIGTPVPVIKDIARLFFKSEYLKAMQATMWLINRSFLKFGNLSVGFRIGEVLGDEARRVLYESKIIEKSNSEVDKGWLIISGLIENNNHPFWLHEYGTMFSDFSKKMKAQTKKKQTIKSNKKTISQTDALTALKDLDRIFKSLDQEYFLVSGTFLGLIRENGFLKHDYDLDIGCFENEFDFERFIDLVNKRDDFFIKELCYYVEEKKVGNEIEINVSKYPLTIKLLHRTYISMDVFVHYEENENIIHGTGIHLWKNKCFGLAKYPFYDMTVLGPDDSDSYLTENYGNWRKEKKDFDCDTGTPNLIFPETPQAYLYLSEHFSTSEKV